MQGKISMARGSESKIKSYEDGKSALERFLTDKIQQSLLVQPLGDNSIVFHKQNLRFESN